MGLIKKQPVMLPIKIGTIPDSTIRKFINTEMKLKAFSDN